MSAAVDPNATKEERAAAEREDAEQRAKLERLQRGDDIRAVMNTVEGRRYNWRLLNEAGLFSSSYTGEAISGAFSEGKRAFAVRLMADLQAECPHLYLLMVEERLRALPPRLAPTTKERLG